MINNKIRAAGNISKNHIVSILAVLLLAVSFTRAQAFEVKFKVSGGINLFSLTMVNSVFESWQEYQIKDAEAHAQWNYLSGKMDPIHRGTDFEGEIIATFHPRFSIGFGIGYIYGDKAQEKTEFYIEKIVGTFIYVKPTVVTAVPLTLSGYFHFFPGKLFDVYIKAGTGYAWSKYVSREGYKRTDLQNFSYDDYNSATGRSLIFQGGLGILFNLQSNLGFFIEAGGRWAKIKGFEEENKDEETGRLYFFEEYNDELDLWQAKIQVRTELPSGDDIRNAEEAVIDFSGMAVRVGVAVRF
ncbi:MAG: outer membrane beta-barrel protein [Candidatus Aminicenantes bacterium]|nr:outer membrane beta-barrel protein [Candidatus Aminicenantes bacterium]